MSGDKITTNVSADKGNCVSAIWTLCVKRYANVSGEMRYFHGTNMSEDKGPMVYQASMTNSMSGEKGPAICEG